MEEASGTHTFPIESDKIKNYGNVSTENLSTMCFNLFNFYLNDNLVSKFRKMLVIEQYSNNEVSKLFNEIFIDSALRYETNLFTALIEEKKFIKEDPYIMALHFYSPLFLMLFSYNSTAARSERLKEIINNHVKMFTKNYAIEGKN